MSFVSTESSAKASECAKMGNRVSATHRRSNGYDCSESNGGRDPRDGKYSVGLLTVKQGECFEIVRRSGRRTLLYGPGSVRPAFCQVRRLQHIQCDSQHYLEILYVDGRQENMRGPADVFYDKCIHGQILEKPVLKLEENEAIVVYRETRNEGRNVANAPDTTVVEGKPDPNTWIKPTETRGANSDVVRRIVCGPVVFVPQHNEWLHEFSWHGTLIEGKGSITGHHNDRKTPHAVNFSRIRLHADHMYYTSRDVRSRDDAVLDVHVMIFFELESVSKMLQNTNDATSDMINAASSDIMSFAAQRSYEAILSDSGALSETETYPILQQRLTAIGYKLLKVVYRGYNSSPMLQQMQESSISSRTKLRLEADTRRQEAENTLMELRAREAQEAIRHKQEEARATHEQRLRATNAANERQEADERHEQQQRHLAAEDNGKHERRMRAIQDEQASKLKLEESLNKQRLAFLLELREMGVDLTQYMCAKDGLKPDYMILNQGVGRAVEGSAPHLHVQMPQPNQTI